MVDFKAKPFYLNDDDINWVQNTLENMSIEEKVSQLFCMTGSFVEPEPLEKLVTKYNPGGYMFRPLTKEKLRPNYKAMQSASKIPMLFPANLESGGNGLIDGGTYFSKPLGVSATGDVRYAEKLGEISAKEGTAVGCNWSFAPICDIDYNFKNPITNVRTFGNDPETVIEMSKGYMRGVKKVDRKMAVCLKHFPGDGVDERDHHLLPSVNDMSAETWFDTFGKVYKELIDLGAESVMIGHIIAPHLTKKYVKNIENKEILPASTNKYLVTDVLRGELSFNGLITTDATPMVGFSAMTSRSEALVLTINAGVDMILFCKNTDEDINSVLEATKNGIITENRLNEAVLRILAFKANLGLHLPNYEIPDESNDTNIASEDSKNASLECANKAITLVKDTQNLLPISSSKTKKIRLTILGEKEEGSFGDSYSVKHEICERLEDEGYEVHVYDTKTMEKGEIFGSGAEDFAKKFDLSIVVANVATGSNYTTRRIDWITLMAANAPWYVKDIPTMFISFASPYHLFDVPYISTFINCYTANSECIDACMSKILGYDEFYGKNPVDVFCNNTWGADFM